MVTACASLVFHPGVTNRMSVNVPMERGSSQNTCVRIVVIRAFSDSLEGTLTHTYRHNQSRERESVWGDGALYRRYGLLVCMCGCCCMCIVYSAFMCSLCVCVCVHVCMRACMRLCVCVLETVTQLHPLAGALLLKLLLQRFNQMVQCKTHLTHLQSQVHKK